MAYRGTNACHSWINFAGQGTISTRDSHNISQLDDDGTGTYTIHHDTNFSNGDYTVNFMGGGGGHNGFCTAMGAGDSSTSFMSTGECQFNFRGGDGSGGGNRDPHTVMVQCIGDN